MVAGTGIFTSGWLRRAWRVIPAIGRWRLMLTVLLLGIALLLARFSWMTPVLGEAEMALYDMRLLATAPHTGQDQRILIVPYTDETLIASRKRSPLDRAMLARAVQALDAMGARAIGIDILIDQPQDEDDQLITALRAAKTPVFLAFADLDTNAGNIVYAQQEFLQTFMERLKGSHAGPASVRFTTDSDGTARAWPVALPGLPPLLARAMLQAANASSSRFEDYHDAIRYKRPQSEDRPVFTSLPIDLFANPELASVLADQVRGRYVLIGGDIVDTDQFETPFTRFDGQTVPGLHVHAQMLAQMLDGAAPRPWNSGALWAAALLVILAGAITGVAELRWMIAVPVILTQTVLAAAIPFIAQARGVDTIGMPAFGWWAGWLLAFVAVAAAARAVGAEQRRFAQSALGKYLPRDIARQIIARPELLALHGERRAIFVLFSDLEGFTKLSHAVEPEVVADLLNRYLDELSKVVLDHGGIIDKFVGDAVVAFWGAPIARADDGDQAARAAYAMWQTGEAFRRSVPAGLPPVGRTRVGLHYGEAIVGNFGGEGRIQYTALGDSMNTAARLESANKALGSNVIASREAVERTSLDWWRPMGRVRLRGRATPVEIFEPAPAMAAEDRARMAELLPRAEAGDAEALTMLDALTARNPADGALANLLTRIRSSSHGEAYDLA